MATQAQITAVQQLYVSYLGRAADKAGLDFWSNAIATGTATIASVATGLTLANEYTTAYGNLSTSDLVDAVYNNVLGRSSDAAGKAFWVSAFANGSVKADTFVSSLIQSLGAQDQATINNKTFVAQTYTDTVGADYTPAGGAAVLVGVDSTAASVTKAIAAIAGGTLPGQVPALGLINAVDTAIAAQVAYETANKAAADALVAKLAATKDLSGADQTTATDAITATSAYSAKVTAITADADANRLAVTNATGGDADTTVLVTRAATADTSLTTAFNALTVAQKTQANTYKADIAAEATAKAGQATAVEKAGVIASLGADASASAGLTAHGAGTTAASLYADYVNGTAAARTAIDTQLKDSSFYATFKASAAKDAAYADAVKATAAAKDALDTGGSVVGSAAGDAYISALTAKTDADKLVTAAKAADADVAAAKALADAYAVKTDAVDDANTALGGFSATGVNLNTIAVNATTHAVTVANADAAGTAKDVFYFPSADKANVTGASDVAIANFGAGDSIVLGSTYTYNSGALSTGSNTAQEFFLVKGTAGVQIVLESTAFGSSTATTDATTGAVTTAAGQTDNTAVITLTGVSIDHVAVHNGVVSYV